MSSRSGRFSVPGSGFRAIRRGARIGAFATAVMLLAASTSTYAAGSVGTGNRQPGTRVLRVCADPNNLPFSNDRQQGFENELASLVARELGARVQYTWWAQRRGFVRNTLNAGTCEIVGESDEAIYINVRSIAFGGRTHSISARVTDIELDRRPGAYRCIPEGGRISVTLTRPIEITM